MLSHNRWSFVVRLCVDWLAIIWTIKKFLQIRINKFTLRIGQFDMLSENRITFLWINPLCICDIRRLPHSFWTFNFRIPWRESIVLVLNVIELLKTFFRLIKGKIFHVFHEFFFMGLQSPALNALESVCKSIIYLAIFRLNPIGWIWNF